MVPSCKFGTCGGLPRTLEADKHDDIWAAFLGFEGIIALGVDKGDEFIIHGRLDQSLTLRARGRLQYSVFDGFAEVIDKFDIDL